MKPATSRSHMGVSYLRILENAPSLPLLTPSLSRQAFGESALITGGNRNASCRAVGFVDCLVLSKVDFDSVIRQCENTQPLQT